MWNEIVILAIFSIIAWICVYCQEKYKPVALIFAWISTISLFFSAIKFWGNYDLLYTLKEKLISSSSATQEEPITSVPSSPPIEVLIPQEVSTPVSEQESSDNKLLNTYRQKTLLLNISRNEKIRRNDDGKIFLTWVPLVGQNEYKIKISADDPFSTTASELEFVCPGHAIYVDLSEYDRNTVMFVSVGIWESIASEWIYTEPTNFILL